MLPLLIHTRPYQTHICHFTEVSGCLYPHFGGLVLSKGQCDPAALPKVSHSPIDR